MIAIGVALGVGRLQAALPNGRTVAIAATTDLVAAFADLRKAAGAKRGLVTVALVPPLVDIRQVDLPPLREAERQRVLTRDAARYFVGARTPRVIGTTRGSPWVAAAEAELIATIEAAITSAGWSVRAIIPSHIAWARAAGAKYDGNIAMPIAGAVELLTTAAGRLKARRRLRRSDSVPDALLLDAFGAAATYAPQARGLELCSAARDTARRRSARRTAGVVAAAAAACLVATVVVDSWGLKRELTALKARREILAPQVEVAMRLRDSVGSVTGAIEALQNVERNKPNWPALFVELSDYLPRDAHLTTFSARGDSVSFTGVAREAGAMLRGLERASLVSRIRAEGAIRQEVTPNGMREHFRVAAEWRP